MLKTKVVVIFTAALQNFTGEIQSFLLEFIAWGRNISSWGFFRVDRINLPHWQTESSLVWKWLLCELCFMCRYTTDNRQWPSFALQNFAEISLMWPHLNAIYSKYITHILLTASTNLTSVHACLSFFFFLCMCCCCLFCNLNSFFPPMGLVISRLTFSAAGLYKRMPNIFLFPKWGI